MLLLRSFLLLILTQPSFSLQNDACKENDDFYLSATSFVLSILDNAPDITIERIAKQRDKVLASEPKLYKFHGFQYSIYTFYLQHAVHDYLLAPLYLYNKFESSTYSNRLDSFLESHAYCLSYEKPKRFLLKYAKFFDEYMERFISRQLHFYSRHTEFKKLISDLSISKNIRQIDFTCVTWDTLKNELSRVFQQKKTNFSLNFTETLLETN